MKLYKKFCIANYFWILRVENDGQFKIAFWEAISAAICVSVSLFLMIFSALSWLSELGFVGGELDFDKSVYITCSVGLIAFNIWYFLSDQRYEELANANKCRFENKVWIMSYTFGPLLVSLGLLAGLSFYVG